MNRYIECSRREAGASLAGATEAINATEFSIVALKPFHFSAKLSIFRIHLNVSIKR